MSNAIIDPREYGYGPAINIPRRGAVDFTGAGKIKSDYWHRGLPSEVVSRNHSQFPAIRFHPSDGVGMGVAFTECEYTEGIAMPAQSVYSQLPAQMQHVRSGLLVITWPGYQHLKWREELIFVHPNGSPLTVAHMAAQVACLWRRFYQKHSKDFRQSGIPLGTGQVSFNHLRLHQIYSNDGRIWQAEVSYVKPQ
ncbi:hypothetical protein LshimejAT787_0311180 [Lyophyllum shimeji]|uniref:Uncharacterized protein n=1 Tax=Lyophyllum shimeji TaxID=47721 RepID=A0A9P3PJC9_LYOSH|nr:hypothetical protein LshimejAT787_0311180 [Lyophyllum shimeji]